MTESAKVRHLLRRFGWGYGPFEHSQFKGSNAKDVFEQLLETDLEKEDYPASPWAFTVQAGTQELNLDASATSYWWLARMVSTKHPLQEKMVLFWHNHFAISGAKVYFAESMQRYLSVLRQFGTGNFAELLTKVSKTAAMVEWLDMDTNTKNHPNENFAREVMELFTLGIGNYTEKDIREVARAFTGWGQRNALYEVALGEYGDRARKFIATNSPMVSFTYSPDLHDDGEKNILGTKGAFTGEEVLAMLAERPETARYICKKLWEWFAYPNPEPAVIERLSKVYLDSKMEIKPVLRAMIESEEFWSPKCVRKQVKSPIDYVVPILRQTQFDEFLLSLTKPNAKLEKPLDDKIWGHLYMIWATLQQQGMVPLYPPNVAGWHLGTAWISTASVMERIKLADSIFYAEWNQVPMSVALAKIIKERRNPQTPRDVAFSVIDALDAPVPTGRMDVLEKAIENAGGAEALNSAESAAGLLATTAKLIFAMPEFQFA